MYHCADFARRRARRARSTRPSPGAGTRPSSTPRGRPVRAVRTTPPRHIGQWQLTPASLSRWAGYRSAEKGDLHRPNSAQGSAQFDR